MTIYQWSRVSQLIRFKIDAFDANLDDTEAEMEDSQPDTMKKGGSYKVGDIILGSVQKPVSFEEVSATHNNDPAFSQFYRKFSQFLHTQYLSEYANFDVKNLKVCFHSHSDNLISDEIFHRYLNIDI
jgi:hypothetical protein